MGDSYKRPKGFADIYGDMAAVFQKMEETARKVFSCYGYAELRPPILEHTELFRRSIGDETDVVQKEMFTFSDRKGRSLTMRPEATAGVMRAIIENQLAKPGQIGKFFTIGPMFRYERPQAGRMRQFHQINCECLGTDSPYADAEIILMLLEFLKLLGLENLTLKLNSLGCRECRPAYIEKLRVFLESLPEENLCEDCRRRKKTNPLRALDCKQEGCRTFLANAPLLYEHNCAACKEHFQAVTRLLAGEGVAWQLDPWLVRGLDYYQKIAFEVTSDSIGAQTAVAGGGRYDGLLAQLGGPDLPGIGFACGMERLAMLAEECPANEPLFYLAALAGMDRGFAIVQALRNRLVAGQMNLKIQSFKSLMRQADKSGAKFALILGENELAAGNIAIKCLATGKQVLYSQKEFMENPLAVLDVKNF